MDAAYIARNVANCERKIESLKLRLKNPKNEDAGWLKSELDGYKATLKKLTAKE